MPAVVGGGLGDIDEVLVAGAHLARAGAALYLFRAPGLPLPRGVDGPWRWPPVTATRAPVVRHRHALTVAPCFGVSAAPGRDEPLGRPGPWAVEAAAVERAYGPGATLHVSLEEFARTFTAERENRERFREGGVAAGTAARRTAGRTGADDVDRWREAFRTHRSLDRPDVLHLLATFRPDAPFHRQFPEIVQVGPLWPVDRRQAARSHVGPADGRRAVWYASPASSARIAAAVVRGVAVGAPTGELVVRSERAVLPPPPHPLRTRELPAMSPEAWDRLWGSADLRIATGSRTLLDAIRRGGPFLYFNGLIGTGRRARRHRPEKVGELLRLFARLGVPRALRRDLDAFSRGQRVAEVTRRAIADPAWAAGFPAYRAVRSATPPDAGSLLRRLVRAWAGSDRPASEVVRRFRTGPGGLAPPPVEPA